MRVLHLLFGCLMVVLVAVALTCAFVTLDAEMEVGPVAAYFSSVECSHNSASETEVSADFYSAKRCPGADRASLTFTVRSETDIETAMSCIGPRGNYEMAARVLKLPQDCANVEDNHRLFQELDVASVGNCNYPVGDSLASTMAASVTGRYAGAGA